MQKHFHHLEAVALERECVEDIEDLTLPEVDKIESRVGTLLDEFSHMVFPHGQLDCNPRQKRRVRSLIILFCSSICSVHSKW